jgi:hypothetical protein
MRDKSSEPMPQPDPGRQEKITSAIAHLPIQHGGRKFFAGRTL